MTTTGTTRHLLASILASPEEDVVRLAYADLLEEQGEGERAEFIRVQVELARLPDYPPSAESLRLPVEEYSRQRLRKLELSRREQEIVETIGLDAALGVERFQWDFWSPTVERGFVSALNMPAADWEECATAILAVHPVRLVRLSLPDPRHLRISESVAAGTFMITVHLAGEDVTIANDDLRSSIPWLAFYRKRWPRITFPLPPG